MMFKHANNYWEGMTLVVRPPDGEKHAGDRLATLVRIDADRQEATVKLASGEETSVPLSRIEVPQ